MSNKFDLNSLKKLIFDTPNDMELGKTIRAMVNNTEIDTCNMCDAETPYTRDTHINQRQHYIEGAGQLCEHCWVDIYKVGENYG
tara:strand:+ start:370 stop:621 length:252 start_codon:yes stop_codon:yes gene_type:complete